MTAPVAPVTAPVAPVNPCADTSLLSSSQCGQCGLVWSPSLGECVSPSTPVAAPVAPVAAPVAPVAAPVAPVAAPVAPVAAPVAPVAAPVTAPVAAPVDQHGCPAGTTWNPNFGECIENFNGGASSPIAAPVTAPVTAPVAPVAAPVTAPVEAETFSVFGFSPFSVFGFSPFSAAPVEAETFSVFSFSPFGAAFNVFGFFGGPRVYSLAQDTKVRMADGSLVEAQDIQVGDELMSINILGLENTDKESVKTWSGNGNISITPNATTTVVSTTTHPSTIRVSINGDRFTESHLVLVKRNNVEQFVLASNALETDLVWHYDTSTFIPIESYSTANVEFDAITINCEPIDIYLTEHHITYDGIN